MASEKSSNIKAYKTYGFEEYGFGLLRFHIDKIGYAYRCGDIVSSKEEYS